MKQLVLAAAIATIAGVAGAQVLHDCEGFVASPANIAEPWEKWSRSFADGAIRVALVDTGGEPVCCAVHLLVLSPSGSGEHEPAFRQCHVVSQKDWLGWLDIDFDTLVASYDPARGLLVEVPALVYDGVMGADPEATTMLRVRINQATGAVTLE